MLVAMHLLLAAARLTALVASLALMSACGMSYPTAPDATPSPISTGPASPPDQIPSAAPTMPPLPSGPLAEIDVLVTGGEFEGSYRAVAANACESKVARNTFTVVYSNDFAADDFVALHLVLRNAAQAQQDVSSNFLLELSLDGPGGGVSYTFDPTDDEGEGDAYLDVAPSDATLDLSATAPDGTLIDLTVICDLASK